MAQWAPAPPHRKHNSWAARYWPGPTVIAVVLSAYGCDGGGVGVITTAPAVLATAVPVAASISVTPGFVGLCVGNFYPVQHFHLRITTSTAVDLDHVTMRLIDGSTLGGPSVTIPSSQLTTQFQTTHILAHSSRTFVLAPQFHCGWRSPYAVAADVVYLDHTGVSAGITASSPLQ